MMKVKLLSALFVVLLLTIVFSGCFEENKKIETGFLNACDAINGTTFRSIRMLEIGLGVDGLVLGYWVISFHNGTYSWHFSDSSVVGSYICDGCNILAFSILDGEPFGQNPRDIVILDTYNGTYDTKTGILYWEGEQYIKVTEENSAIFTVYGYPPFNITVYNVSIPLDESEAIMVFETISGENWNETKEGYVESITKTDNGWSIMYGPVVAESIWDIDEQNRTINIFGGL
jgi:hypothetical protein